MLELRHLSLLRAVAEHGSISAAAEAMSYTPSAASQQLRLLERNLDLRLVTRSSRGARLTPAGLTLLDHAHAIVGRTLAAEAEMRALAVLAAGRLRVSVFPSAGAAFIPEVIAEFTRRYPGVELTLIEAETDESLGMLKRHEVDLIVGYDFAREDAADPQGSRVALFDDPMRLALPRGHPLASKSVIPLADLAQEAWIDSTPSRPCSQALHSVCAAEGFSPRVVYRSDDYATIRRLIDAGVGMAMIPDLAADLHDPEVEHRATAPALPVRRVYAATTDSDTPAAKAMIEIIAARTAASP